MTDVTTIETPVKKPRSVKKAKVVKAAKPAKKKIGRPFLYPDQTLVRMEKGMLKRIHAACKTDEGQGDFMRAAVTAELSRRRK